MQASVDDNHEQTNGQLEEAERKLKKHLSDNLENFDNECDAMINALRQRMKQEKDEMRRQVDAFDMKQVKVHAEKRKSEMKA